MILFAMWAVIHREGLPGICREGMGILNGSPLELVLLLPVALREGRMDFGFPNAYIGFLHVNLPCWRRHTHTLRRRKRTRSPPL